MQGSQVRGSGFCVVGFLRFRAQRFRVYVGFRTWCSQFGVSRSGRIGLRDLKFRVEGLGFRLSSVRHLYT